VTLTDYLDIAHDVVVIGVVAGVIPLSKAAGLGGLAGADTGGVFRARRGIERTLFQITIGLSLAFFGVAIANVIVS